MNKTGKKHSSSTTAVFSAAGTKTLSGTDRRHLSGGWWGWGRGCTKSSWFVSSSPDVAHSAFPEARDPPWHSNLHFRRHHCTVSAVPSNHPVSNNTAWPGFWSTAGTENVKSTNQKRKTALPLNVTTVSHLFTGAVFQWGRPCLGAAYNKGHVSNANERHLFQIFTEAYCGWTTPATFFISTNNRLRTEETPCTSPPLVNTSDVVGH